MPKSIQLKITFFITLFAMLIFTASGALDYYNTKKTMKDSLEKYAVNTCKRLAQNLAAPLWDMAEAQIDSTMLSEMAEERIYAIIATNKDDTKITFAKKRNENWEPVSIKEPVTITGFSVKNEIKNDNGKIGHVQVLMSSKFMDKALFSKVISIIVTAVFLSVVIAITVYINTNKIVINRVNKVSEGLKQIAEGDADLTQRLNIRTKDEIGILASFFNQFIEKLQLLILSTQKNAASINQSSGVMANLATKMSESAQRMSHTSHAVAAGAEEMNNNVNSVTIAMNEASSNIGIVAAATEEMTATISEIAKNTGEAKRITLSAVNEATAASHQINELGVAARDISKVTEVINDISDQTNLLALNATIEAARAGEAGKGFAVVANEIKELAKQTSEATNEIKAKILGIQTSTETAVSMISKVTNVISGVDEIVTSIATAVEEQSATTRDIAQNVNHLSSGIAEVNNRLNESSLVISQITREITDVSQLASDFTQSSSEVSTSAESLTDLASKLDEIVGRFKA